jgi:hypothetical protein
LPGWEPLLQVFHEALIDRPTVVQLAQIVVQGLDLGLGRIGLAQKLGLPVFKDFPLIGVLKPLIDESEHKGPDNQKLVIIQSHLRFEVRKVQIRDLLLNLCLRPLRSRCAARQGPGSLTES